jgi:propanediol dehydratase large subunit
MTHSRRFSVLSERNINKETFVEPWPEAGLMVADSSYDSHSSLRLENDQGVELNEWVTVRRL